MPSVALGNRSVLRVAGIEARSFLQGLVTCDVEVVRPGMPGFGALLAPQGKIIVDFFLHENDGGFLLDCAADLAADLLKRLKLYRLRAKLEIEDVSATWRAGAAWGDAERPDGAVGGPDPRSSAMGLRFVVPAASPPVQDDIAYLGHRISCGVPEGGADFAYGDTFPHEANMDLLHGVDFRKGCYVGQEVVSRVEHRGMARKRILKVSYAQAAAPQGTPILAEDLEIGSAGSSFGLQGLALVRVDRLADAKATGAPITAAGHPVEITSWGAP
jgi:folate-binding protein YgfZ